MYFMKVLIQVKNPDFGSWIFQLDNTPYFCRATMTVGFSGHCQQGKKAQFYDIGF